MKKISALLVSAMAITGCGGGGDVGSAGDPVVTLQGKVAVCEASAGSAAKVSLPYGDGQAYEVTTNADGTFSLEADTANIGKVDPVALTVESDNCKPESIFVDDLRAAGNGGTISLPQKILEDLGVAEFVVPPPFRPLTHLGDDQYGGPANSRLQVASEGLNAEQPIGVLTPELKGQYSKAYVEFSARGMQTESLQCATFYQNQIGLSVNGATPEEKIVRAVQPGASSADGGFTRFSIPVNLADFPAGSTLNFFASTGQCDSGGNDFDDFEITSVLVRLAP